MTRGRQRSFTGTDDGKQKVKRRCADCERERSGCYPVVLTVTGDVWYACPTCYRAYDYKEFMK